MCGRLNVVTDPLCQLVTEQLGLKFHAPTNHTFQLAFKQHVNAVACSSRRYRFEHFQNLVI